jgi:hypothetical protein
MGSSWRSFGINGLAPKSLQRIKNMGFSYKLSKNLPRLCVAAIYE